VDAIPYKTWATYAFPQPRYGHLTSNIVESLNSAWGRIRFLQPLKMMDAIWSTTMETIYNRYHRVQQNTVLADVPLAKFKERQKTSRRYQVFKSKVGVYQVQIPDSGLKYTVELAENGCSCRNFWEYHGPCAHAIAACRFESTDPYEHFSKAYTVKSYRRTYEVAMPPLSVENLPSDLHILPPLIVKKRGRPREKRIRKGAHKKKQTRCTNCLQLGHNKRRCVAQPARNGRAERARDWDISSSESNSELERELAPFVEQARAKARAKARSKARDNESDLSDLRSSDFEGLEGGITGTVGVETSGQDSRVGDKEVEVEVEAPASPASPALQLRPKRTRKVPAKYQG
jgi:hypothetical protein